MMTNLYKLPGTFESICQQWPQQLYCSRPHWPGSDRNTFGHSQSQDENIQESINLEATSPKFSAQYCRLQLILLIKLAHTIQQIFINQNSMNLPAFFSKTIITDSK